MSMPPGATFHYAGVVPETKAAWGSGEWKLKDQSGALVRHEARSPRLFGSFWKRDPALEGDLDPICRLVGLQPTLRISGHHLILEAGTADCAQTRSAEMTLDPSLIDRFQGGDVLTLVRTGAAGIGVSVLRGVELVCAVGAVTRVPLGNIQVRGCPRVDRAQPDTWVEVFHLGQAIRLGSGQGAKIGHYTVSVLRSFQYGYPGKEENVAISLASAGLHEASVRSAKLLAGPNAGLTLTPTGGS